MIVLMIILLSLGAHGRGASGARDTPSPSMKSFPIKSP